MPVIYILDPYNSRIRSHNPNLAHLYYDDAGVTRGDGVFETLLVTASGHIANAQRHAQRFLHSARCLDLPIPDIKGWLHASAEAIAEFAVQYPETEGRLTWSYTRGRASTGHPSAWLCLKPAQVLSDKKRVSGVDVLSASRGYSVTQGDDAAPWQTDAAKTLNYANNMAALRWAKSKGADEVIFLEPGSGRVLEATTASVIVVKTKHRLRTPSAGGQVLRSTGQEALFEYAEAQGWKTKAKELSLDDLYKAESVWLVSSVRRGVRVASLNGKVLPEPENAREIAQLIDQALSR